MAGCCKPCLNASLQLEGHPAMIPVYFDPAGEYAITNQGRIDMLINLESYRAALERCNATIEEYNKSVQ